MSDKPTYKMPFAANGAGFGTLQLTAQLVEGDTLGNGVPIEIAAVRASAEPGNLLLFDTGNFAPGATSVAMNVNVHPQATAIPVEPVPFEIFMTPAKATDGTTFHGGEVRATGQVRVSDLLIEWSTDPAIFRQGDGIVAPLVKGREFHLQLKAKRIKPGQGVVEDDSLLYEFATEPTDFPKAVFGCQTLPNIRGDDTSWRVGVNFNELESHGLSPTQAECRIDIQPSTQGETGKQLLEKLSIPVRLAQPKAKLSLVEPELPLLANGQMVRASLQVQWDVGDDTNLLPAAEMVLEIEKKTPASEIDAKMAFPAGRKTDKSGILAIEYTPPEMYYRFGGKYEDVYAIYMGSGDKRKLIGELKLPLSPTLKFALGAVKLAKLEQLEQGLEFEPTAIMILPEERAKAVSGVFCMREKEGDATVMIPVSQAQLVLSLFDGKEFKAVPEEKFKVFTNEKGSFVWELPEIASILPQGKGSTYTISKDDMPQGALTDASEAELTEYRRVVDLDKTFLEWLPGSLPEDIRNYRTVWVRHLASMATKEYEPALGAIRLFGKIVGYGAQFYKHYRGQWSVVWDRLKALLLSVIDALWEYLKLSDKIVEKLAPLGRWLVESGGRLVDAAYRRGARMMIGLARVLRDKIPVLKEWAKSLGAEAVEWVLIAEDYFGRLFTTVESTGAALTEITKWVAAVMLSLAAGIGALLMLLLSAFASVAKYLLAQSAVYARTRVLEHCWEKFAKEFVEGCGDRFKHAWGENMEQLIEQNGKAIIDGIWGDGIKPVLNRVLPSNDWLKYADIGRVAYWVPVRHGYTQASPIPPKLPSDYKMELDQLSELRRDQYNSDAEWERFAVCVDYIRDVLDISVNVGKTLMLLLTALFATASLPVMAAEADKATIAFKVVGVALVDLPRMAGGFWAVLVTMVDPAYALYVASDPKS